MLREAEESLAWYVVTRPFKGEWKYHIGEVVSADVFAGKPGAITTLMNDRRLAPLPLGLSVPEPIEVDGQLRRLLDPPKDVKKPSKEEVKQRMLAKVQQREEDQCSSPTETTTTSTDPTSESTSSSEEPSP